MAVRFIIPAERCTYSTWIPQPTINVQYDQVELTGRWVDTEDFTNGLASQGGTCEVTGDSKVSFPLCLAWDKR